MAVIHATGVQDATQARRALIERIEQVLPQTQCRQCGFDGCTPYAEAIADQQAAINRCPPGGLSTLAQLGQLTGRLETALDVSRGQSKPLQVAVIDESQCIGCTLCIQACPVDAIIGAARQMHVVRALECSGCELCIAPCPVDCISMRTASLAWDPSRAASARARHDGRAQRAERIAALNASKRRQRLEQHSREARDGRANSVEAEQAEQRKQTMLAKALARARARRAPADRPMAADGEP